jgi:hypothetical protein
MDVQFGSVEAIGAAASYVDNAAAVVDYDSGGGFAQFGAKVGSAGSAGTKIRTVSAGVVKDAIIILPDGLTITLLPGSTLAVKAMTAAGLIDASNAAGGQIKFPAAQNASANTNTLDDYDEYTAASAACAGAITTAAVWKLTKVGNLVTLTLPAVTGTATAIGSFAFGTAIPAKYRPSADLAIQAATLTNNAAASAAPGVVYIASGTGTISIYRDGTFATAFTAAATAGLSYSTAVSWTI